MSPDGLTDAVAPLDGRTIWKTVSVGESVMTRRRLIALCMLLGLPLVPYYLWICLTFYEGALVVPASGAETLRLLRYFPFPTATAALLYGAWLLLQLLLQVAAPGDVRDGIPLDDGSRLRYWLNGWFSFWFTLGLLVVAARAGWIPATIAYDQFGPLLTTANIAAFLFAVYLYRLGKRTPDADSSGDPLLEYVMGRSLNPRTRGLDWKFFCESRPGLILWVAIDLSLAAKQYELHGAITTPMLLVNAFQFLYVADYFFHEEAVLSTWDIRHERFGWMLAWGCLVWVPFTYTIQAYYLVTHTHEFSSMATAALIGLNAIGYVIFRGANIQKHRFRRDPSRPVWGRPPAFIRTASGALLLTSGWWGLARHLNYFGDLLMALAWCLTAGFEHALPYFYVVYFLILLIHRERRDHAMCAKKYGRDWEAYCRSVRWRIVPGLY